MNAGFAFKVVLAATTVVALLTLGAGEASATHVACGDTITDDTTLDSDLHCAGEGIHIGADGITLDLDGHVIEAGPLTATGIQNGSPYLGDGHDDVTIRNGVVRYFDSAIALNDASRNVVRDLSVQGETYGIVLRGGGRNVVSENFVYEVPGEGIFLDSANNTVSRNRVVVSGRGIALDGTIGNDIDGNVLIENREGIFNVDSGGNYIHGNEGYGNDVGIRLVEVLDERVERNFVHDNGVGLVLAGFGSNRVVRNRSFGNAGDGILVEVHDGIDNVVARNVSSRNGDDGIDIEEPGTLLRKNEADENGDLGVEAVSGALDEGGNRAWGNANPLQCLNVACK
jgi:parallel beta-helix repeat protein